MRKMSTKSVSFAPRMVSRVGCDRLANHRVVDLPRMFNTGIGDQGIDILSGEVLGLFKPADDTRMGLVDV